MATKRKDNKLTPKQEAFVLAYFETNNSAEAYRRAYNAKGMAPASIDKEARRLLAHPLVAPRIAHFATQTQAMVMISLEDHMMELKELRDLAKKNGKWAAAIKAEELRGKLCKFYVDQVETGAPGDFARLSDDELNEVIASEMQEVAKVMPKLSTKH